MCSRTMDANTTIANYAGTTYPLPTTREELRDLLDDGESDGCTFTYEQLSACRLPPPVATRTGYSFSVCYGELCALDSAGNTTHTLDGYKWKKFVG